MRTIFYRLSIGYVGCEEVGELEVDDNATDKDIDLLVHEMALDWASSWVGDKRLGWHIDMTEEEYEEETTYFYESVDGSWEWVPADED